MINFQKDLSEEMKEIIHVMLEMNSNSNIVKNFIIKNINLIFKGYVSDTLSYNSNPYGDINN